MAYKRIYKTQYARIKIVTNSYRIHKLVENHLDFNNISNVKPKIDLEFHLEENFEKNRGKISKFVYNSWISRENILISSAGEKSFDVITDPQKGYVEGSVGNYDMFPTETILGLLFVEPLRFILAYHGLFFIHASMIAKGNDCILISGNQNSGKSTLALTLAENGFNFLSDDDCFVKTAGGKTRIFPFPTKMGLHDHSLKRYPELHKYIVKNHRYGGKRRFSLNSIGQYNNMKSYNCKLVIFPVYKKVDRIHIKEIPDNKALDRLINENLIPRRKEISIKNFWTLCELTKRANAFELVYSDDKLADVPGAVEKILK